MRRSFYAIFDGRGGAVLEVLAENFHILLAKHMPSVSGPWKLSSRCGPSSRRSSGPVHQQVQGEQLPQIGLHGNGSIIVGDTVYTANCGDSHAYLFKEGRDPIKYAMTTQTTKWNASVYGRPARPWSRRRFPSVKCCKVEKLRVGKHRVWPGGLAVTRSFGDFSAKLTAFSGVANSILSQFEETRSFTVAENFGGFCGLISIRRCMGCATPGQNMENIPETPYKSRDKGWDEWDSVEEGCHVSHHTIELSIPLHFSQDRSLI